MMAYLSQLQMALRDLSTNVTSELEESNNNRMQHYNSMKQLSDEKQNVAKQKLALDWKMLLLKRRYFFNNNNN